MPCKKLDLVSKALCYDQLENSNINVDSLFSTDIFWIIFVHWEVETDFPYIAPTQLLSSMLPFLVRL